MDWITVLYFIIYWGVFAAVGGYVFMWISAVIASGIIVLNPGLWEVDLQDPTKKRGIIRDINPFDIVVVKRAGSPAFPVIAPVSHRFTFKGLQDEEVGMRTTSMIDWEMETVKPDDEYKHVIQSKLGWWSPLYVFRMLVFKYTGKHVVRYRIPFTLFGYPLYKPNEWRFERLKTLEEGEINERASMKELEKIPIINKSLVVDTSDHLLREFSLPIISSAFPTKEGYSIRIEIAVLMRAHQVYRTVSWENWSSQVRYVLNHAVNEWVRSGSISSRYAFSGTKKKELEERIESYFTDSETYAATRGEDPSEKMSLMETIGFTLQSITITDIVPADSETETALRSLMSIEYEGQKNAKAAGFLVKEQADALKDADAETKRSVVAMTAAKKGSRTDIIIGGGDADRVYRKRTAQNTEQEGEE